MLLKECKYTGEEWFIRYINDDLEISSEDSGKELIKTKYCGNAVFEGAILINTEVGY